MAWKSISVRLGADVSGFVGGIGSAIGATKQLGNEFVRTAGKTESSTRQVTGQVGRVALGAGLAAAVGLGLVEKATIGFDKAMSGVEAVTSANARSLGQLRTAAIEAGQATVFTASDAARAEAELAKAGVEVADVLGGGLRGSLDLAAAGQIDLKDAATITAQALNVFDLRGSQAAHVADVLAAGANKSAADVQTLGESLRMGGLLAHQTGLSLEDTVGVLALFADHALIGSDAGTSLKVMLQRLVPQSKEAAEMMKHLDLRFFDATGRFIGLTNLAAELQSKLGGLSQQQRLTALTTLFGADAIRSANILVEQGAAGVDKYVKAVNDQGAAQRMAAAQLDNLAGDIEQFRGSLEAAFIEGGSSATGFLRGVVQWSTAAVNGFSSLPGPAQTAVGAVGGLVAVVGTLGGSFLLLAPRITQALNLYRQLTTTAPALAAALRLSAVGLGVLAGALAIGTVALSIYGKQKAEAKAQTDAFTQAIKAENDGMRDSVKETVAAELAKRHLTRTAEELGVTAEDIGKAVQGSAADWQHFQDALIRDRGLNLTTARFLADLGNVRKALESGRLNAAELAATERALGVEARGAGVEMSGAAAGAGDLTQQIEDQAEAAKADAKRIEGLTKAVSTFVGAANAIKTVDTEAATSGANDLQRKQQQASDALQRRHQDEQDALDRRHRAEREAADASVSITSDEGRRVNAAADQALQDRQGQESRALRERQQAEDRAAQERADKERAQAKERHGTLDAFAAELERQAKDAREWETNLVVVARRFGPDVARAMADLGQEGAGKVAELAGATPEQGQRVAAALRANVELSMDEAGAALDRGFDLLTKLSATGGQDLADKFVEAVRSGEKPLADVVAEYLAILTPLTQPGAPVLGAAGQVVSHLTGKRGQERGPGGILYEAQGDLIPALHADRGWADDAGSVPPSVQPARRDLRRVRPRRPQGPENHRAEMVRSGPVRVWHEPETGGESYIPLAPSKRERSTAILRATAAVFGLRVESYASGGFSSLHGAPAGLSGPSGVEALAAKVHALAEAIASRPPQVIDARQTNHVSGPLPTAVELDVLGRHQAYRLAGAVQR